ncbi:MAG: hypothetical protein ACI9R3_006353 [Verrucomicrobiales bacterium]|jgi:hypothetical protein
MNFRMNQFLQSSNAARSAIAALVCGGSMVAQADPQPEFALPDINPESERSGQAISPRNYKQQITAWYFGREW